MINGIGVVGWGVGGIEAEAGMLGQPVYFLTPDVVGVELKGKLREGVTATDLVLTVTEMLRKEKVVGKFVEFFGEGTASLAVPDRATIANMAPEYGATMGFFPVDEATVDYLAATGRTADGGRRVRVVLQGAGTVRHSAGRRDRLHEGARRSTSRRSSRRSPDRSARRTASSSAPQGEVHELFSKPIARTASPSRGELASASTRSSRRRGRDRRRSMQPSTAPRDVVEMVDNRPTPDRFETGPKHVSSATATC